MTDFLLLMIASLLIGVVILLASIESAVVR